nr:unnamed protein product [Digitaria exilis]
MLWRLPTATSTLLPPPTPSVASRAAFVPSPASAVAASFPPAPASSPQIHRVRAPEAAPGMSSSASSAEGCDAAGGDFTEVVIVRHGETSWNASRIIQGHLDAELNDIGRQQAVAVVLDPALRERHIGDMQGLKFEDAATQRPEAYKAFLSHKRNQQIPGGGESLDQLSERCVTCLYNIVEKHKGERVIVVSHGGTIRELYRHASPTRPLHGKIHNTSVSVILVSATTGRCIVKMCGDISHLQKTGVLENAFGGDKTSA